MTFSLFRASRNRLFCLLLAGVAFFATGQVQAEQLKRLYTDQVLVLDQGKDERDRAISQAFSRVFRRLTGQALSIYVASPPRSAENYLEQYSYAASDQFIKTTTSGMDELLPALTLELRFSPEAMESYIKQLGAPVWSANRPSTLVWMVIDRKGERRFISPDVDALEYNHIRQQDALLGLPFVLPLHDLEDQLQLGVDDVWNLDQNLIHRASLRYNADSLLVVRAAETVGGKWLGSWHYYLGGQGFDVDVENDNLLGFVDTGLETLASYLAERFTVNVQGDHMLQLTITGIPNFAALVEVRHFLGSINNVESLLVTGLVDDSLSVTLAIEGDEAVFRELVALGNILEPVQTFGGNSDFMQTFRLLTYRYKGKFLSPQVSP